MNGQYEEFVCPFIQFVWMLWTCCNPNLFTSAIKLLKYMFCSMQMYSMYLTEILIDCCAACKVACGTATNKITLYYLCNVYQNM